MKPYIAREHEFEAQHGLPEALPEGERILWQGAPTWQRLSRQVFHADKIALYFAAMMAWRFFSIRAEGATVAEAFQSLTLLAPLFGLCLAALCLLGWLAARSTAYTLTNRRVVMRIGIVLTVTYNLPLKCITSASLRPGSGQSGDVCLDLEPTTRIAWLHLWPHVRPWRVAHPQPMMRGIDNAAAVAAQLQRAWADVNGQAVTPANVGKAQTSPTNRQAGLPLLANP